MRIFKDLGMVEQLGSGVPRILDSYNKGCFEFSDHFLRMTFPARLTNTPQVGPQVTPQVRNLISVVSGDMSRMEIQESLGLSDKRNFNISYLLPALKLNLIEMTIPDKPNSRNQRYRLTDSGEELKKNK